jgi:DNA polymerase I
MLLPLDGWALNTASSVQLTTFLFGGALNEKTKEKTERERVFKVPRDEIPPEALEAYRLRDEQAAAAEDPKGRQGR